MMKRKEILNFPITTGRYNDFVDEIIGMASLPVKGRYVCVANVHMVIEAYKNQEFSKIVHAADIITPDGKPLTWALRLLHKKEQDRVAGMDLLPDLLAAAAAKQIGVFFFGGTRETLDKTKIHLEQHYPSLILSGMISPPFRALSTEETDAMVTDITNSNAGLVFVVLGCPKQENWMAAMKDRLKVVMVGVGGALPVMVKLQKRAPLWMQKTGLEWLYRLAQEPKRLFKRYAYTNTIFLWLLMKEFIRIRILNKQRPHSSLLQK